MSTIRTRRRVAGSLALATALALAASACSAADASSGDDAAESVVKWAVIIPTDWDPVINTSHYPQYYTSLVYEPILGVGEDGQPTPGLAESWEFNDTGDAVTLHLREGNTFTDGTPVDSAAITAFFDRALTEDDSARKRDFDSIASVTADDELTFTLHLSQPDYGILLRLGPKAGQVPSPTASEDLQALKQNPIGAGPFEVSEFVEGDHVFLDKNPDYWDAENIHVDRIEFYPTPAPSTALSSVTSGVYDLVNGIDTSQHAEAEQTDGVSIFSPAGNNNWYIDLNTTIAPFDDPAVAKAVQYAIDRDEFIAKAGNGVGDPAHQPYQKGEAGYVAELDEDLYDPEEAKRILTDAGYDDGEISISFPISEDSQVQAEILQSQLQAVGITAKIDVLPSATTSELYFGKSTKYPLYITGTHNYLDPLQTLGQQLSANGNVNVSGVESADFSELLAKAKATPLDSPDYAEAVADVARSGISTGGKVYLYTYHYSYFKSDKISDFPRTPGSVSWKGVTATND